MTLTHITDMGDEYYGWAGDGPHARALLHYDGPGSDLMVEFQGRVRDAANAWLAAYAHDTSGMDDESRRAWEVSDFTDALDSVDCEAIAAELLAAESAL